MTPTLRAELLRIPTDGGGLDLIDLLLEQRHTLTAAEARKLAALEAGGPADRRLMVRLRHGLLLEGPDAEALRRSGWAARLRRAPQPPGLPDAPGPWELAASLPDFVAPPWRSPERWRRLAEDRAAGRRLLRAEGFCAPPFAAALRDRVAALPFDRRDTLYVQGRGFDAGPDDLPDVLGPFRGGPLHTLLAHVMGDTLPARIFARAWCLEAGDRMAVHADGLHYVTTFSLGLCEGWTAAAGGAIAFGVPSPAGIEATERWLPHLGDLVLFRPTAVLWHAVEPVTRGTRYTLTGHYVAPEYPG